MSDFTLDTSTLAGGQFGTQYASLDGEFRAVQYHFSQSGSNEDAEIHFFEIHMDLSGISEE